MSVGFFFGWHSSRVIQSGVDWERGKIENCHNPAAVTVIPGNICTRAHTASFQGDFYAKLTTRMMHVTPKFRGSQAAAREKV